VASLGIKITPQNCTIDELRSVWRIADEAGFDHLWAFDHFNPITTGLGGDVFEGMTLLAAMAEVTSRVRIGLMVAGNTYRHPAVLAKMATTIDHLSGGRLEFGLGASGVEIEHTMLGIPFSTPGERVRRLGEALTVCRMLWTEERSSFDGRYYTLTDAVSNPKPRQRPHPPIWVGGAGEKLTLRVVAEHADVWNVVGSVEEVTHKSAVLDQHCADIGRDPSTLKRSIHPRFDPANPSAYVDLLHSYMEVGFTDNIVNLPLDVDQIKAAEIAAERVLPAFVRPSS
jgi:F420-dependent oxidoreductase-like protein